MKSSIFTLILLCALFPLLKAQPEKTFVFEENGKISSMEDKMLQEKIQGLSICLVQNLEVDTALQWGYRDVDKQLKVNEETLFQVGGMAAALTKFAVLRLVKEGRIDLDADVNQYLVTWKLPENKFTKNQPVTIRDLLLNRRGFKTISKPKGYLPGDDLPTLQQMLNGLPPSKEAPVRLKANLNKSGNTSFHTIMILHQLLEDIHQKPFASIMQSEVLTPLGMKNSVFTAALSPTQQLNAAFGYQEDGALIDGGRRVYPELACAGLWTTPTDYARFITHILKAAMGKDNRFLNQPLAQETITPADDYRCLLLFKSDNLYWGGASEGFYTQFEANAEEGWAVIVFMNSHLKWKLNGEIRHKAKALISANPN